MKHINKLICLFCFTAFIWSCEDDIEQIQVNPTNSIEAVINTPSNNDDFVLNIEEASSNPAITISWEKADYQTPVVISYTVEFAQNGTDFAEPFAANVTTNTFFTMTISEFNSALASAGLAPFTKANIDIRIKSDIGSQKELPKYSDPITVSVTPFTTDLPTIAVPGNHQGWDPTTAPLLAAPEYGATNYEGYVWLDGVHKFIAPDSKGNFAWGNTDWGDDGTTSGKLVDDGESDINATAGHYLIQVDTDALTYSENMYTWGLIGSGTPDNWDSDQDMTYDPASKTWTVTLDLSAEEIKFRANDAWDWNYGDTDADESLEPGGDNIKVSTAGNYTVVLDLSTPRKYTYKLTLN